MTTFMTYKEESEFLRQQLAASQAREVLLREAMYDYFNQYPSMMKGYILDAINQPTDTSALEAMIAKAGEVMRKRCAIKASRCVSAEHTDLSIRDLPGVTLGDLK